MVILPLLADIAFGCAPYLVDELRGRPREKCPLGEFRISPRKLLRGVSLPGGGTGGVGIDERVEGASRRPPWFILLDVDQVDHVASVHSLVEPHGGVAIFDDPNQAPDEVDAVRKVIPIAASSVNLHGNRLVHAFLLGARIRPGRRGKVPAEPRGYRDPNTPSVRGG
jgi:hypothetical protein